MAGEGGKRGSPKITLMYGVWMGASISYGTLLNALTHGSATVGTLLTASYMAARLCHIGYIWAICIGHILNIAYI